MPARRSDPPIVVKRDSRKRHGLVPDQGYRHHVAAVLYALAVIFAVGAAFDMMVAWVLQRAPGDPTWEFFTVASTVENLPRIVLGIGLAVLALHLSGSTFLLAYRFLGALLLGTGLIGLGLALLAFMDFFALRSVVPAAQQSALLEVAAKTVLLGLLEAVVLLWAGRACLRRPS